MNVKMIPAKFYNRLVEVYSWIWIVVHCTQSREVNGGAQGNARWFANPWDPKKQQWRVASAHTICDNKELVQCVPYNRIAYHAKGLNVHSLGIELVGDYRQTREQWLDEYGLAMFAIAAPVIARWAKQYGIPLEDEITEGGILLGHGGVTTHAAVTRAYKVPGGHMDPGQNFPMDVLLTMAAGAKI
jgi:N-acetyl-anhydromuramyl-L-alanine amidase AmpD